MVRAILEGRKTQTRRPVRELPGNRGGPVGDHVRYWRRGEEDPTRWCGCDGLGSLGWLHCPYGEPGDRLWVRETWATGEKCDKWSPREIARQCVEEANYPRPWAPIWYRADDAKPHPEEARFFGARGCWRPSIHMPRWASRLLLEVTDVRVERVQDISEEDARAEGVGAGPPIPSPDWWSGKRDRNVWWTARDSFRLLWDSIYAPQGIGWEANPWVWGVGFRVLKGGNHV